ncbi:hypothetical protein [Actinoallomurus iriomotensis]|uniref:Asp23/Gls24 family envelope stress response protein n=1 Tax=Actinoallomurus iriomotensis TaxID=478107 RepID=A0A9W6RG10_9ACTN|nr:hypothetical protein [Actinoallomurus iriomotensis]GLY75078.1 hypothetical protein Airi01_033450 [Actinoallomurus iriomotensis]
MNLSQAGRLAERIATAVADCPSVARLSAGPAATYLPGRTVPGVAVREDRVRIAVVAAYGPPIAEVAEQVRAAAREVVPDLPVDVAVEDIEVLEAS